MDPLKGGLLRVVLEDDNSARVGAHDEEVLRAARQAERHQRTDDTEHLN